MTKKKEVVEKDSSPEDKAAVANFESMYYEFKVLEQQLKQLQEQLAQFEAQEEAVQEIQQGLDAYEKVKEGADMLVPLHNGVFVEAVAGASKKVKINVGANVMVEKTIPEVKELLDKQFQQLILVKHDAEFKMQQVVTRMQEIEEALQKVNIS